MTFGLSVSRLQFRSGAAIQLNAHDLVLIVGPNNSGKSQSLRDVVALAGTSTNTVVLSDIGLRRSGSVEELDLWLKEHTFDERHESGQRILNTFGYGRTTADNLLNLWRPSGDEVRLHASLEKFFFECLSTDDRLRLIDPPENVAWNETPRHPINTVQRNAEIERAISTRFHSAFGQNLYVHRNAGRTVPLHVGHIDDQSLQPFSHEYASAVAALPLLNGQGDGMRSFAGLVLHSVVAQRPVMLIDEPEAFLHPPQARYLAKFLAQESAHVRQLFMATHSGDIVRGAIDSKHPSIRIIRLQRSKGSTTVRELDPNALSRVWRDPLLRQSNILDGLFHEMVVVTEGDADSQFYAAVLEADTPPDSRALDLMFVHTSGKHRIPLVVRALAAVGVPTIVVVDFDIFSEENPLRGIVEAAGGRWDTVEADWKVVKNAIDLRKPEISATELRDQLRDLVSANESADMKSIKMKIDNLFRRAAPWSLAKALGLAYVPNGEPTAAANRLLRTLANVGVLVVPVGALEQFCKSASGHGPAWLNEVLTRDLKNDPELGEARELARQIRARTHA